MLAAATAGAQDPAPRAGAYLAVSGAWPGPIYSSEGRGPDDYVAYLGQPLVLSVTLAGARTGLKVLDDPAEWAAMLTINFTPTSEEGGSSNRAYSNVPYSVTRVWNPFAGVDRAWAPPHQTYTATIQIEPGDLPGAGYYNVRATLQPLLNEIPLGSSAPLTAVTTIGVQAVQSETDELNILYTFAARANTERRHQEARIAAQKLLARRPQSVPGWFELSRSWWLDGNCKEAVPALRRLIHLVQNRADPTEYSARHADRARYLREAEIQLSACGH